MNVSGIRVRAYADDDREAIFDLRQAVATVDRTDDGLTIAEPPPEVFLSGSTQHEDTFVVHNERGRILAVAQLQAEIGPQQGFAWAYPIVHPEYHGTRVEKLLIDRLWERASEHRRAVNCGVVQFYVHCGAHQADRIALYESCGLRFMRLHPHMIYHPLEKLARPAAPPGITVRPYLRGIDDRSAVDAVNEAFADDWESTPVTSDKWSIWLDAPQWRQDLNLVAVEADQVVGLCLCKIDEERSQWLGRKDGYVDTLCVRPSFQRRGVGAALLLTGLRALRNAGMVSATLDADEDSPTQAPRFYEGVGFRAIWHWAAYLTELA
jgi:mycothiol synthase